MPSGKHLYETESLQGWADSHLGDNNKKT